MILILWFIYIFLGCAVWHYLVNTCWQDYDDALASVIIITVCLIVLIYLTPFILP